MAVVASKRSAMTLYFVANDVNSHRARIVLAEKGVSVDAIPVEINVPSPELLSINPYGQLPTLVDRDLVLYDPTIITEYLDERFPHPPLMPVYPVIRAKCRTMIHRIEKDWLPLVQQLTADNAEIAANAQQKLLNGIVEIAPVFAEMPFFLSEDFSLVDCFLAPILWQFVKYQIELPPQAKAIKVYMERLFSRPSFKLSLAEIEKEKVVERTA